MILCDWLGDDFPRYPEFVQMLRAYERRDAAPPLTERGMHFDWFDVNTLSFIRAAEPFLRLTRTVSGSHRKWLK